MSRKFTIIELLVVICIIAILAGMLLTVFDRATARSRQNNCSGQMKQLGTASAIYANEDRQASYPGPYPHGPGAVVQNCTWQKVIARLLGADLSANDYYVKNQGRDYTKFGTPFKSLQIFGCPSDGRDSAQALPLSYLLNIGTGEATKGIAPQASRLNISKISSASGTIHLLESHKCAEFGLPVDLGTTGTEATVSLFASGVDNLGSATVGGASCRPNNVDQHYSDKTMLMHGGAHGTPQGTSLLFDGHVELVDFAELRQTNYMLTQYRK